MDNLMWRALSAEGVARSSRVLEPTWTFVVLAGVTATACGDEQWGPAMEVVAGPQAGIVEDGARAV